MEKDLHYLQSLLWEFYKTWVNNHTVLDGSSKELDMHKLYERLTFLLNTEPDLSSQQQQESDSIVTLVEKNFSSAVNFIVDVVGPEKIFCLSYEENPNGMDYADLLLIISDSHREAFLDIEPVLHFACLKHYNLSCSLFKEYHFYNQIREGHIYYCLACNTENVIYDNGRHELPEPRRENADVRIEKAKLKFYTCLSKAKTFYETAEIHWNSNLPMATFMLHQAAESYLRALMKSLTGQDRPTHSINTLLRFSRRFTSKLSLAMNIQDPEGKRLIELLELSYLGYRYSERYQIEAKDLDELFARVEKLHELTEQTFLDWLGKYEVLVNSIQNTL